MLTLSWRLLELAAGAVDWSVDMTCLGLEALTSRFGAVATALRGEVITREEAAREILQVPDEEWDKGKVIELSRYRRVRP